MALSIFDLFTIGIGPSSSHTVGPMRAARFFTNRLMTRPDFSEITRIQAELFGSLGLTGRGHGTGKAVFLGWLGERPDLVDPDSVDAKILAAEETGMLSLGGKISIPFSAKRDIIYNRRSRLPFHANGMTLKAFSGDTCLEERTYYSVGGGFIVDEDAIDTQRIQLDNPDLPHQFRTGKRLLELCSLHTKRISDIMLDNELSLRPKEDFNTGLRLRWQAMQACVERGLRMEGELPGGLHVKRRAKELHQQLISRPEHLMRDPLAVMDWVNLYALAVNEENAAGGRVVTAPTNGAAGIIPAVLHYYERFVPSSNEDGIQRFLLAAGAIGMLYKENASISGAEVGCQGEVGVACSMAAAGLTEALGGSPEQVENAAEIGMEHNLGLTCDPIGGLVQIPCIERNAMGSMKAINASRMALRGDGKHYVSLDKVIRTMKQTGADMKTKYKETSRGGLAVNIIEC